MPTRVVSNLSCRAPDRTSVWGGRCRQSAQIPSVDPYVLAGYYFQSLFLIKPNPKKTLVTTFVSCIKTVRQRRKDRERAKGYSPIARLSCGLLSIGVNPRTPSILYCQPVLPDATINSATTLAKPITLYITCSSDQVCVLARQMRYR